MNIITRRIRLTPLGSGVLLVAVASWLLAVNYAVNLAYFLAFWLFGFLLWALPASLSFARHLNISATQNDECFARQKAPIHFRLHNKNTVVYIRFQHAAEGAFIDETGADLIFTAPERGIRSLPPIEIYQQAPLSLIAVTITCQLPGHIIVYPEPLLPPPIKQQGQNPQHAGKAQTVQGHDEVAFLDAYQIGDSLKHIAWQHYAKTGAMLTKITANEISADPELISYQDHHHANTELIASWLCYRVLEAEQNQQRYFLETPNEFISPDNHQRKRALYALATMA